MTHTTKVPTMDEFLQRYKVCVGGTHLNYCIKEREYNKYKFIQTQTTSEMKVGMLYIQECCRTSGMVC